MADLLFVVITVAFFALAVGYVRLCNRIIGPDPVVTEEEAEPEAGTGDLVAAER